MGRALAQRRSARYARARSARPEVRRVEQTTSSPSGVERSSPTEPFDVIPTTTSFGRNSPCVTGPRSTAQEARCLRGTGAAWTSDPRGAGNSFLSRCQLAPVSSSLFGCQRCARLAPRAPRASMRPGCPGAPVAIEIAITNRDLESPHELFETSKGRRGSSWAALSHEVIANHEVRTGPPRRGRPPPRENRR